MTTKIVALLARLATALLCLPAQAGTVTYFHNDLAGTPLAATDANGNLLWRQGYKPYGERLDPKAPAEQQPWFTGKAHVEAAGLSYFGARWYDPQLGRFMGVDPRGFDEANVHSFNRYAYANNNPYRFVDPDGRQAAAVFPVAAGALIIGGGFRAATPEQQRAIIASLNKIGDYSMIGRLGALLGQFLLSESATTSDDSKGGNRFPDRELPRDKYGNPTPDAQADGPHTQLGQREGRNGKYDQAREFDASGKPVRDIDFTDHGRPQQHPSPHQHRYLPNPNGGTPARGPTEQLP